MLEPIIEYDTQFYLTGALNVKAVGYTAWLSLLKAIFGDGRLAVTVAAQYLAVAGASIYFRRRSPVKILIAFLVGAWLCRHVIPDAFCYALFLVWARDFPGGNPAAKSAGLCIAMLSLRAHMVIAALAELWVRRSARLLPFALIGVALALPAVINHIQYSPAKHIALYMSDPADFPQFPRRIFAAERNQEFPNGYVRYHQLVKSELETAARHVGPGIILQNLHGILLFDLAKLWKPFWILILWPVCLFCFSGDKRVKFWARFFLFNIVFCLAFAGLEPRFIVYTAAPLLCAFYDKIREVYGHEKNTACARSRDALERVRPYRH